MCGRVLLVLVTIFVALVVIELTDNERSRDREKRWTYLQDDPWGPETEEEIIQPRLRNKWYYYVHKLAKSYGKTNCYVCSIMPISTDQVTLHGRMMSKSQAKCFASLGGVGYQSHQIKIDDKNPYAPGLKNGTCALDFWVNWNRTIAGKTRPQRVIMKGMGNHSMCYEQSKGSIPMGNTTNCVQTAVHGEGAPVKLGQESNGTWWVQGGWWLCGANAYPVLPANWSGVCAPVFVSDHTFFLEPRAQPDTAHRRRRRDVSGIQSHDSVWGTDVPNDQKHWTTGQKVALALFPWVGVGKNLLRLETVDYRLGMFINSSIVINSAQNGEISALRTMVMQHRMALDLLTAASGGTCVLLNTTCCTYITDEVHSQNMTNAMNRLVQLQKAEAADKVTDNTSWLWSGSWIQLLIKGGVILVCIFILMCCLMACVIPCIKTMVTKMVSHTFVQYVMLKQVDSKDED